MLIIDCSSAASAWRIKGYEMRIVSACVSIVVLFLSAHFALAQETPVRVLGLMKSAVIPASDAVFAVGKAAPKNDTEWAAVERGAARLVEAAKALTTEAPATGGANWVRFANEMSEAALTVGKAAKAKNVDAVLDAGDALYTTCDGCHRQYFKK
jgi:hypothetical protein